jgi:2-keto-4-pentenoate hydratase/2-oxohepta-3-ene-1,7-dioic acid hydratase in catechol pathway
MDFKLPDKTYTAQRVFCIGRNYVAHIEELGNEMPGSPVIFMKPATSLVPPDQKVVKYPEASKNLHFETELVILIGRKGIPEDEEDARNYIAGLAVGFDLTMRDVQDELREKGLSWEISKAFDQSAPIGEFSPFSPDCDLTRIKFTGMVNDEIRQRGNSGLMIFPITRLIKELSKFWELLPGDLIYTGTPAGVGSVNIGDELKIIDHEGKTFSWQVK